MSEQTEQGAETGFSEDQVQAIEHVLKDINIDEVSKDEVFIDVINRLKRFNFEMTVALYLLEKKTISDMANDAAETPAEGDEKPE
jgi:hypothetical protein